MSAGPVAATAVKVVQPGEGRRGGLMPGVGVIFKIDGADSGGALAVVEHLRRTRPREDQWKGEQPARVSSQPPSPGTEIDRHGNPILTGSATSWDAL